MPNKDFQLFPEDREQLYEMLMGRPTILMSNSAKIYCRNIDERRDVLRTLQENGYEIGHASQAYIDEQYEDFTYSYPGRSETGECIACYVRIHDGSKWIDAEDVLAILCDPSTVYTPPTDTEFASALSALLG